jgi:hypothetical protein
MNYSNIIINIPRALFHLGENAGHTAVKPFRILRNKSWYNYVQGILSMEDMLKEMTETFKATAGDIRQTIDSMCHAAVFDKQVWETLKQLKAAGSKIYGLLTITEEVYDLIPKGTDFDNNIFDRRWRLSDFYYGTPAPGFWAQLIRTEGLLPSETLIIDRERETCTNSSAYGIRSVFLDERNQLLNVITPGNRIISIISDYLASAFPEGYNKTLIKYTETGKEVITPEPYAPLLLWSVLPDAIPGDVVDKLKLLGKKERINFFENEKDIQDFNMLPFDIDTSAVFLGTMFENGVISREVAERELARILRNVNESGILLLYFDESRPRIEPVGIINVMYLAYLLNREDDPVIIKNQDFVEKILINKGWEYGTYFYPSPEFFLLIVFRFVKKFGDRVGDNLRDGLEEGLVYRTGRTSNPLELAIRLLISQWIGISDDKDIESLLLQRIDRPGFQWNESPLYSLPSALGYMYNPVFDAALIRSAIQRDA